MLTTTHLDGGDLTELELSSARAAPAVPQKHKASAGEPILSIRATVLKGDAEGFIAQALHDIRAYMQEHHVAPAGAPFSICRPCGNDLDIEAGWPTDRPLAGTSRIHCGALPRPGTAPQGSPDHPGLA